MGIELPKSRLNVRQIQNQKRNIPLEQIIAIQGQTPVSTGIETAGNVIGQAIQRRAELQQQGQQLAKLEALAGQPAGSFSGLDPSMAQTYTVAAVKENLERQEKLRQQEEKTKKVRELERQFGTELGYKPGTLGDDYDVARMQVQADLQEKRMAQAMAGKGKSDDTKEFQLMDQFIKGSAQFKESHTAYKQAKSLTNQGTGVGDQTLVRLLVRVAEGKGGRVSDSDVDGFINSQNIPNRVKTAVLKNFHKGEIFAPETRQYINQLLDDQYAQQKSMYDQHEINFKELSRLHGVRPEAVVVPVGRDLQTLPLQKKATHRWNPATGQVEVLP